ncbi:sensor domain-containing diguanylate cyclase [Caballeronia sp. SBC2]|uniref:sensor domain-containing diguanylate cyclase n=1 Tax=Caballeronia sp. SBC2 TaxID=2705547 RepID=UPI0013E0FF19|nr:sensor domain-containing diguanylate cyclase [Caballeronia sp. SBC2]QIE25347.1 Diguanylate cyclase, GGDEF domain [Caballeronia sp. SBC2]
MIVGVLGSLLAVVVIAISLVTLLASRDAAVDHAHETSRNVTAVLVSNIARTIETSDNSLRALVALLNKPAIQTIDPGLRHELLFDRTAAEYVTGMGITDDRGRLIDGCCSSSHTWDFSDRDYFIAHRQSANVGLYVSSVYRARSRPDAQSIAMTRRMNRPDGSFGGVAIVAIDVEYFKQLLAKLDVGPNGVTAIVRTDGTLVARNPPFSHARPVNLDKSLTFPRMVNHDSGFYAAPSISDGVVRLYTFQRVPGTPLIAVIAPAESDVLASWKRLSWIVGISASSVSLAFCTVVWLLAFALRDHAKAQVLLKELTQTDPLTGLKNRRALDHALENEWGRLQRGNGSLSLLFVDADSFKQYNDEHGHAQGDIALKRLAECINRHVRRPGDLAARYGGEEFVVVLPNTEKTGAVQIAEAIRQEVERGRLTVPSEAIPHFTVSIGCATGRHSRPSSLDQLINSADLALYEAKRSGRNAVVAADDIVAPVPPRS